MRQTSPTMVQLDRYFYKVIGAKRGGFGRVWLLERSAIASPETIYGARRAAKTFEGQDQHAVVNELSNWILLHHKNILPLIKISRLNFRIAALMEMRDGTLQDVLEKRTLTWSETRTILLQICEALKFAYERFGFVHLDIKPANVLVDKFPHTLQVSDWGISRLATKGRIAGGGAFTPGYLAPERLTGKQVLGPSSDIFAMGMIAIACLCGRLPYSYDKNEEKYGSRSEQQFMQLHSGQYFKSAEALLAPFPPQIGKLILSCVHPNSAVRQSDYSSLLTAFERVVA